MSDSKFTRTNVSMTKETRDQINDLGEWLRQPGERPVSRSEVIRRMANSMHASVKKRLQAAQTPEQPPQE